MQDPESVDWKNKSRAALCDDLRSSSEVPLMDDMDEPAQRN